MTPSVSRQQVVNRLREAGFRYNRKGDRVEFTGSTVPRSESMSHSGTTFPFLSSELFSQQASLTTLQIERFLGGCEKTHQH